MYIIIKILYVHKDCNKIDTSIMIRLTFYNGFYNFLMRAHLYYSLAYFFFIPHSLLVFDWLHFAPVALTTYTGMSFNRF